VTVFVDREMRRVLMRTELAGRGGSGDGAERGTKRWSAKLVFEISWIDIFVQGGLLLMMMGEKERERSDDGEVEGG
jgi:hypothetical protein